MAAIERTTAGTLTVGFGTTVGMWTVGYFGRLPGVLLPSPVVLVLMLACLFAGGFWLGRATGHGFEEDRPKGGAAIYATSGNAAGATP